MPSTSSAWHQPSAVRALAVDRAITEPMLLPRPMPTRNPARISENVYVVAPSSSDRSRVHTTSAASAVAPEMPMVR